MLTHDQSGKGCKSESICVGIDYGFDIEPRSTESSICGCTGRSDLTSVHDIEDQWITKVPHNTGYCRGVVGLPLICSCAPRRSTPSKVAIEAASGAMPYHQDRPSDPDLLRIVESIDRAWTSRDTVELCDFCFYARTDWQSALLP